MSLNTATLVDSQIHDILKENPLPKATPVVQYPEPNYRVQVP